MSPLYPEYSLWEARLSTFDDATTKNKLSHCQHSGEELAVAGFFYEGYDDCVRCFYCGLGLKSWNSTDNVYEEHKRYVEVCPFLSAIKESSETPCLDLLLKDHGHSGASSTEHLSALEELSVLQSENRYLKTRHLCRMCFRNPVREIFLPCGEVLVCSACSDVISSCPSCEKTVVATASVYLV